MDSFENELSFLAPTLFVFWCLLSNTKARLATEADRFVGAVPWVKHEEPFDNGADIGCEQRSVKRPVCYGTR